MPGEIDNLKRAVTIVLDGVGVGALPDADVYGDEGSNSVANTARAVGGLKLPTLAAFGLGNITHAEGIGPTARPAASWGKMAEASPGKDSTTGHWELMGCGLQEPFPTYHNGFPEEVIEEFERKIGRRVLGNKAASGTAIIEELGREHMKTGRPIVYTSADSVFQIAAHEDVIDPEELYRYCAIAREILVSPHNVARVIARPFRGEPGSFVRTAGRKDFSLAPPCKTFLDVAYEIGLATVTVGKIDQLFAHRGIARAVEAKDNEAAMRKSEEIVATREAFGFLFVNLIDFDMRWGHRRDVAGYAHGLEAFDAWFARFHALLEEGTLVMVTSDHGCDPTMPGSDHTREYVPILAKLIGGRGGGKLGTRRSFSDVAATLAEFFGIDFQAGKSFLSELSAR